MDQTKKLIKALKDFDKICGAEIIDYKSIFINHFTDIGFECNKTQDVRGIVYTLTRGNITIEINNMTITAHITTPDNKDVLPIINIPIDKQSISIVEEGIINKIQYLLNGKERLFEIWMEGYRMNGDSGTASKWGEMWATTFQEACDKFANNNTSFAGSYKSSQLTWWGCGLYDNEVEARENFG